MSSARHMQYSYDDYLRLEDASDVRHEFFGGDIFAMADGTPEHGALAFQAGVTLKVSLRGCTPLSSDVRVHVGSSGLITYPDVSFVYGPIGRSTLDRHAIVNPAVVVEVTSPSTDAYDRGEKLRNYQELNSVQAVVFVSSYGEPRVTVVERSGSIWRSTEYLAGSVASLAFQNASFAVSDIYEVLKTL
ncbi:MAG: Uma2 family endonuclease [Archangium sp.]